MVVQANIIKYLLFSRKADSDCHGMQRWDDQSKSLKAGCASARTCVFCFLVHFNSVQCGRHISNNIVMPCPFLYTFHTSSLCVSQSGRGGWERAGACSGFSSGRYIVDSRRWTGCHCHPGNIRSLFHSSLGLQIWQFHREGTDTSTSHISVLLNTFGELSKLCQSVAAL